MMELTNSESKDNPPPPDSNKTLKTHTGISMPITSEPELISSLADFFDDAVPIDSPKRREASDSDRDVTAISYGDPVTEHVDWLGNKLPVEFDKRGHIITTGSLEPHSNAETDMPVVYSHKHFTSVTVAPAGLAEVHRSGLGFGSVTSARFDECMTVLVGEHNRMEMHSLYSVERVHVDVDDFARTLSPKAALALQRVVQNPDSVPVCRDFQRSLRAVTAEPAGSPHIAEREAGTPIDVSILRCPVAVVGDYNIVRIDPTSIVPNVVLPFAELLHANIDLVQSLGRHLQQPNDQQLERIFNQLVQTAVTPERLRSMLDGVDFDGSAASIHHGWKSVDVHGAAASVGENNTSRMSITIRVRNVAAADIMALLSQVDTCAEAARITGAGRDVSGLDRLLMMQSSLWLELIEARRRQNAAVADAVERERMRRRKLVAEMERLRNLERAGQDPVS